MENSKRYEISFQAITSCLNQYDDGNNALHSLFERPPEEYNAGLTEYILDKNIDINAQNKEGLTPAMVAIYNDNEKALDLLLDRKIYLNLKDKKGSTLLHYAVAARNEDLVKKLLDKGALHSRSNIYGATPLQIAEDCNFQHIATILKEQGATLNEPKFHLTKEQKTQYEKEFLSITRGLINSDNPENKNQLHILMENDEKDLVKVDYFLAKGVSYNHQDSSGMTPSMVAINLGNYAAAKKFVTAGESLSLTDSKGRTLLHYAAAQDDKTLVELIATRADVDAEDKQGYTPLNIANLNNQHKIMRQLIFSGADISKMKCLSADDLICSIQNYDVNVFNHMVSQSKDINAVDVGGNTALHHACAGNDIYSALVLLDKNANTEILNKEGLPAYDLIENPTSRFVVNEKKYRECAKEIEERLGKMVTLKTNLSKSI